MLAEPAVDIARRCGLFGSAALLILAAGCGTPGHQVKVDAMAREEGARDAQSYVLRTRGPAATDDSLRAREATEFIRTALSGKGLYEAPSAERADLVIDFQDPPANAAPVNTVPGAQTVAEDTALAFTGEIGRASCRERVKDRV